MGGSGMFWRMRAALDGNFDTASTMHVKRSRARFGFFAMRNKAVPDAAESTRRR